ncbi:MAG: COQ9 family protein [Sphingomonas sp.]|nr:COQ9 family protein [Sphingomonas sp.]
MTSPLDQIRQKLALSVAENAVFDGWSKAAVEAAAAQHDIPVEQALLAFPDKPSGMVDAWIEAVDVAMAQAATESSAFDALGVTKKIRWLIWKRLEIASPAREAVRSALAILAAPQNIPLGFKTGWRSADAMWRLAGDTSTDYNHYTKRIILSGVYGATLLAWLDDDSEEWTETAAFLDRRLADVAKFEKAKAHWAKQERPSISRFLGRLRYPVR